ncbi:hypothetical protein N656DRAFT_773938 [Canariomyces notabilis]|uniref:Uncharacterized protein n=1 Tax=Canariomyces notabilis TaxID=2074819 RepID=A0AAN6YXH7_9PEZI|nr:hypothetical protein N656DRAFT_773938 [Canariomyces arenarius]
MAERRPRHKLELGNSALKFPEPSWASPKPLSIRAKGGGKGNRRPVFNAVGTVRAKHQRSPSHG